MKNIIDYARTYLKTFDEAPFNQVDSLVLSQLSYLLLEPFNITGDKSLHIYELLKAEHMEAILPKVKTPENNEKLLIAAGMNPRFRDITVGRYESKTDFKTEQQFAACTYTIPGLGLYVAFRGTDCSIIGWKEDFNMAFTTPIPSQVEGVRYLTEIAEQYSEPLIVGGHSKGGNIAVYASAFCGALIQKRIQAVYSHDGPGFAPGVLESPEFIQIESRIRKTVPKESLIGMVLENQENYSIVESDKFWVMQHDPYAWTVGDDDFIYSDELEKGSVSANHAINEWLMGLTIEQRELFVDTLFRVLEASGAGSLQELSKIWLERLPVMLAAVSDIDGETKTFMIHTLNALVKTKFKKKHMNLKSEPTVD